MTLRRATVRPTLAFGLALALVFAGCGKDDDNPVVPQPDPGLPAHVPQATTPTNLLARFEASYDYRNKVEFGKLLTADYRFAFSNQSDPELVATYGDTWDQAKELVSLGHLLAGFTDEQGMYQAPAADIELTLLNTFVVDDPDHADSTEHYKYAIVQRLSGVLVLADGREFHIDAPHDLYLVRGDAAVLTSGQDASADRWYIRRWKDKTPPISAVLPATAATIGRIKATYLR